MKYTPQQLNFKNAIVNPTDTSCIVLEAVAGSGKTTSILAPLKEIDDSKTVAIIAFNKSIAGEVKEKVLKLGLPNGKVEAGTCHSFGFNVLKKVLRFPEVKGNKIHFIVEDYWAQNPHLPFEMKAMIRKLVSYGKQYGAGDKNSDPRVGFDMYDMATWNGFIDHYDVNDSDVIMNEEIIKHTINVLRRSNKNQRVIDFDDMIYLPLIMNLTFPEYDFVIIDEAQDINWARREMAARMLRTKREYGPDSNGDLVVKGETRIGRLIAVGDRHQAIYGFTGAGADSLDEIKKKFDAVEFPLSVCFRCDKEIVKFAQTWNQKIQPSETAGDGLVRQMSFAEFMNQKHNKDKVMLCRNTKPLVATAFHMIRKGIAVYVEGRDIGEGLKKLAQKWKITKLETLVERLEGWKDRETAKAKKKDNEAKIQVIDDQVATLMVIIERCREQKKYLVSDVIAEIDFLFKDTTGESADRFVLSTIHKSKGREWDTVFWMDRVGTLPSRYAKQPWQLQQESNLCYVAATRAKHELYEVAAFTADEIKAN